MIKEGKEKREKNSNAVIKTEPSGSQVILPEATVKEEPGTESHLNGVEEGGGSVPTTSSNSSCSHLDLKPSGLIGSTNAGTLASGRMRNSSGASDPACLGQGDTAQEPKHEENSTQDKPTATGVVKTEINGNTNHEFQGDRCDVMPMGNISLPSSSAPPPNGIQPLPSNVINKQPGTMEAQYMQQQSQIFVFSTTLANKSAEAVLLGQFPSIIAYHCAQPGTKKYLEKHPLKMNQFNRQNPAQWLNNLAQMKQKMNPVTSPAGILKGLGLPGGFQGPPTMMQAEPGGTTPGGDMWNQNQMMQQQPCAPSAPGSAPPCPASVQGCTMVKDSSPAVTTSTGNIPMLPHSPRPPDLATSPNGSQGNLAGSLQGVKIPDENLTPQQRQHREEQLARLRNMQQMLFPEQESPGGGGGPPEGCLDNGNGPPPGMMGPGGAIMPHKGMMMAGSNQITPTSVAAQIEWQKLQHQFYEERKKKGPSGLGMGGSGIGSPAGPCQARGGPRAQGPPPPYHQTPRSASVPTAMPSPNPSSPNNNPTSNLSLPSPRAASALNSPAEPNRQQFGGNQGRIGPSPTSMDSPNASRPLNPSNPGTPVSTHLSPNAARKELSQNSSEFSSSSSQANSSSQQPTVDGMFGRTLQSLAQQKQLQQPHQSSKEPNLMPVPSPQQIQYLNTFEGQELTIQKQPNTSLKDTNIRSPSNPPAGLDSALQADSSRLSGGPGTPLTPTSLSNYPPTSSDLNRFPIPSPLTPTNSSNEGGKPQQQRQPPLNKTPTNDTTRFLSSSPQMGDGMGPPNFLGPPHFLEVSPVPAAGGMDVSPTSFRTENVPLNPNGTLACNGKAAHFDPISSMAQMSQQLTNSVANSPNPGGMMGGPNMMPFNPGMDLDSCQGMQEPGPQPPSFVNVSQPHSYSPNPGMIPCSTANPQPPMHTSCSSPKPGNMMMGVRGAPPYAGGQRMMGRPPGPSPYNGANVQVKASAPNTIQYLPAKPQAGNPGPRGPPSLEFLQRFTNPLSNLDTKMPTHNLQYFPNNNQPNMGGLPMPMNRQPNGLMGGPGPGHGGHMGMNGPMMGPNGPLGMNLPMSGGMVMGPGGPGMGMAPLRGSLRPGGMMRMQQMGGQMFGGPPNIGQQGGPEQMFSGGPGQNMPGGNFVPGSKSSPMGLGGAPDASQPLPPSMGQSNNFKNSPFIGPTTADPNYAQQFHNFQQQLYATNTRSQMNNQAIGPNQSFFVPK